MKRMMINASVIAVLVIRGVVAADAPTSKDYVQGGLIAHWDGIDNTLTDGVRSHKADATTWSDLAGLNDVTIPSRVTVEERAMFAEPGSTWPTWNALKWKDGTTEKTFSGKSNGEPSFTVEVVSARGTWTTGNEYKLQQVFATPRGSVGYRIRQKDGFYVYRPISTSKIETLQLFNGENAEQVHAFSVDFGTTNTRSRIFMDGVDVQAQTTNGNYTNNSWRTDFAMFGNELSPIRVYAIRVYKRPLSTYERARNHQIDRVRFFGAEKPSFVAKDLLDETWTGSALKPEPVVMNPITDQPLVKGTDYTVSYADNVEPGTATVTVTGIGEWEGSSVVCPFQIARRGTYLELAYIESTGTQFIDTGYLPNPTTKMDVSLMFDGEFVSTSSGNTFFGCVEAQGQINFAMNFGANFNQADELFPWFNRSYLNGAGDDPTKFRVNGQQKSRQTFKIDAATGKGVYGTTNFTTHVKTTTHTENTLRLFGKCDADGSVTPFNAYKMRVFGWKIWDGEILVRDFVPCRASGERIGLYDRVNKQFYENAGLDTFSYALKPGLVIIVR